MTAPTFQGLEKSGAVAPTSPPNAPPSAESWSAAMVRTVLGQRALAWALAGGVAFYFGASRLLGFAIYRCPFHAATGHPCPGCGMSRALAELAAGNWREALRLHPFAPYLIVWAVMLAGAALLPARGRDRWAAGWAAFEARTRFHAALLVAFTVFGIARLLWSLWRSA